MSHSPGKVAALSSVVVRPWIPLCFQMAAKQLDVCSQDISCCWHMTMKTKHYKIMVITEACIIGSLAFKAHEKHALGYSGYHT